MRENGKWLQRSGALRFSERRLQWFPRSLGFYSTKRLVETIEGVVDLLAASRRAEEAEP